MAQPIYVSIADARKQVLDAIAGKQCEYQMKPRVMDQFEELDKKAHQCNNIARLRSIEYEVDTLKIRLLNSIPADPVVDPNGGGGVMHEKKNKKVSIKSVNTSTSWQLETKEDVDKHIKELRDKLYETLEEDTVIHIVF